MKDRSSSRDDTPPAIVAAAAQSPLDEFCMALSRTDTRVELIAAFYATEAAAGRMADTDDAFKSRYEAFQGASPVQPKAHAAVK